jgi:hypothetical protein
MAGLQPGCRSGGAGARPVDGGQDRAQPADGTAVVDADCPADAQGGGVCPVNFCGYLKSVAALALTETAQGGADSLCDRGRVCVATSVAPSGDAISLTCVAPAAGGLDYGMSCSKDAGGGARCKDDSLCIGAAGATFCSSLCRIDADCAAGSYCIEYPSPTLPNQSVAMVGMCTPRAQLAQTTCTAETDCPAGQGCVRAGDRTQLLICAPGGTRSLGQACTTGRDCRSGDCFDRDFRLYSGGNRTYCSGVCAKNSDCSADQRCVSVVVSNNGTPIYPLDDVVVGNCRTLFAPVAATACQVDQDCVTRAGGGDTCDPTYNLCYKKAAVIGGPCADDDACGLGAACVTGPTFAGGACLMEGCLPAAAGGVDLCPGAQAKCSQRASDAPLHRCYEGCTMGGTCTRVAEAYFCSAPQDTQPVSICLSR